MDGHGQIYARYVELCTPASLALRAEGALEDANCRTCPPLSFEIVERLAEGFTPNQLLEAGIDVAIADAVVSNPALFGTANHVVALRKTPAEQPYALLTNAGVLPPTQLAATASLQDYDTVIALKRTCPQLLVTCSLADFFTLRRYGYAVTLANGLAMASNQQLEPLFESELVQNPATVTEADEAAVATEAAAATNLSDVADQCQLHESTGREDMQGGASSGTPVADEQNTPQGARLEVILVAWSPAQMSLTVPREMREVVSWFRQYERILGADLSAVAVWHPSPAELAEIRFCQTAGIPDSVTRALEKSLQGSLFTVEHCAAQDTADEMDYRSALARLQQRLSDPSCTSAQWEEAQAVYARAVEREIFEPLLAQALALTNPHRQSMAVLHAQLAQQLHLQLPLAFRSEGTTVADPRCPRPAAPCSNSATMVLKSLSTLLSLQRELDG